MSDDDQDPDRPESSTSGDAAIPASSGDEAEQPRRDLPKWNRARVKRKAPAAEERDAFQTTVRKAGRDIMRRPWAVIGLIVAVAGVGAGIYAWRQHGQGVRAEATSTLAHAAAFEARGAVIEDLESQIADRVRPLPVPVVANDAKLRQTVDDSLTALEDNYTDSPANIAADLIRAARLAEASDFNGAEQAYRGFIAQQPGHALVFIARDGLIISLESQGRIDDALTEVESIEGQSGDFFRDQALWHKGRLLEASGERERAVEVYKQYIVEYPLDKPSLARDSVRARLEQLDPSAVPAELPDTSLSGGLGGLGR